MSFVDLLPCFFTPLYQVSIARSIPPSNIDWISSSFPIYCGPESRSSDRSHGNRYRGDQLMVDLQHANGNGDLHQIITFVDEKMLVEEVIPDLDFSKKARAERAG
jgi:hypothetical protein